MKISRLLLAVLTSALTVPVAQAVPATKVFFGNGVFRSYDQATDSRKALERRIDDFLGAPSPDADAITYGLAYNYTGCNLDSDGNAIVFPGPACFTDLLESYIQETTEDQPYRSFWRRQELVEPWDGVFTTHANSTAATLGPLEFVTEPMMDNVAEHVAAYRAALEVEGRRVVVFAHSQGNYFANRAFGRLTGLQKNGLAIISVGTPAEEVAGDVRFFGDHYTTAHEDVVMAYLRSPLLPSPLDVIFNPLDSNVSNGFNELEPSGHAFIESYLRPGNPSANRILGHYLELVRQLSVPSGAESILNDGSFDEGNAYWLPVEEPNDFWLGTTLNHPNSSPGYAAGGTDSNGFHKNGAAGGISQTVAIAPGATTGHFSFELNVDTTDGFDLAVDFLEVRLLIAGREPVVRSFSNTHHSGTGNYLLREFRDIVDLTGVDTLTVEFFATTNATATTVFRIDDVSLAVD